MRLEDYRSEHIRLDHYRLEHCILEHIRLEHMRLEHVRLEHFRLEHFRLEHFRLEHFWLEHFRLEHFKLEYVGFEHMRLEHCRLRLQYIRTYQIETVTILARHHKDTRDSWERQTTLETTHWATGWLRLVGSLKLQVSFAKEPYKRDYTLQKRPIILRSLLISRLISRLHSTSLISQSASRDDDSDMRELDR